MQVAVIDSAGVIVRTNSAWRSYGDWEGIDESTDPCGGNYLRACRGGGDGDGGDRSRAVDGGVRAAGPRAAEADGEAVAEGLESVLAGDADSFEHEYACHSPDERRWFLMRAAGFEHAGEAFAQVTHLDITERKLAEATVQSRNDRLETLAGVLAHDLRNPLQVVQGRTALLDSRFGDDGDDDGDGEAPAAATDAGDHVASIDASADRIETIIEDALRLARGGFESEESPAEVRLREAAEAAWDHVRSEEATVRVVDSFAFEAAAGPLGQVLENLFANAVEHAGADVTLTVGTVSGGARPDEPSGFFVADDGPGVPPGKRAAVFEPGHTTGDDGTGLGLAIVEQFVEAQGWYVDLVESDGGGARFEVRGIEPR